MVGRRSKKNLLQDPFEKRFGLGRREDARRRGRTECSVPHWQKTCHIGGCLRTRTCVALTRYPIRKLLGETGVRLASRRRRPAGLAWRGDLVAHPASGELLAESHESFGRDDSF